MGRYSNEVVYDRIDANGVKRKANTIRIIDRKYNLSDVNIHKVKNGESLLSIANDYYDNFSLWYLIADKNPLITNPFELVVGSEIVIPEV